MGGFVREDRRRREEDGKMQQCVIAAALGVGRSIFTRARLIAFTSINALTVTSITRDRNDVVNIAPCAYRVSQNPRSDARRWIPGRIAIAARLKFQRWPGNNAAELFLGRTHTNEDE